ncbi:P-loop containing nucleoside triphosphate hydrolase protein [Aspergillus indologenus CBS 114.80]|uniref:P-loop containing nucleoside triphosphate hydrolase protein n=1 Tax=Aspergillus indologenus CBS 114.80 TaxID=1450541 RepID=A0A2V5HMI3_9EURO|nr:P-loop containing nucleoside triphosphate hydrolase protein [Aspergillus indologenus CBS 114.80]
MNRLDFLGLASQDPNRVISFPASQSLHASTASAALGNKTVSTGLPQLDEAVTPPIEDDLQGFGDLQSKGLPCGHVTEIFGPPGAGKTAIALNTAATALAKGEKVVWIDTGPPLPRRQLSRLLAAQQQQHQSDPSNQAQNLIHIHAPTLPHLLSLIHHPPPNFPPPSTTLLVVDSISAPFPPYFPNPSDQRAALSASSQVHDKAHVQWLVNRKWNVLSDLATQLAKLASTAGGGAGNMAVLVTNQTHTRIRGQVRATLCPVVAGSAAWESCVFTRVVVYQDFVESGREGEGGWRKGRVVEVMKRGGRVVRGRVVGDTVVGFGVREDGLYALDTPSPPPAEGRDEQPAQIVVGASSTQEAEASASQRKRKAEEIADSQDEEDSEGEFGWIGGDEVDAGSLDGN